MKSLYLKSLTILLAKSPLLAVAVWLACATSGWAAPALDNNSVSQFYGDDINSAAVYSNLATDNPAVPYPYTSPCPWVTNGLANAGYTNANGWNFTWADSSNDAEMMPDLSYSIYQPWVVQMPVYTDPYGEKWGGSFSGDPSGTITRRAEVNWWPASTRRIASRTPQPRQSAGGRYRALDSGVLRDCLWRSRWKRRRQS